jgi:hypothetical protein
MPVPDIEKRLAEMREFYPSDDHVTIDEAIETIKELRAKIRKVSYGQLLRESIEDLNPAAMFIDGMDEAIVGYAVQWGSPPLVVYDSDRIVEILAKDMDVEEAAEFFEYNIECAYVGPGTPMMLYRPEID